MKIVHVPVEWTPTIAEGPTALYTRIAQAVAGDVRAGRLGAGDRLPGARPLALRLGVHRNTVAAAYRELCGEGWLISVPRGGMRVAAVLFLPTAAAAVSPSVGYPLPERWLPELPDVDVPGTLNLHGGHPDLRLLPLAALGRAWRRALRGSGRSLVDYGDPRGHRTLRAALGRWLRERRALAVDEDGLLVTRGSQQALHLAALSCLRPGDRVAVEALGYAPAWTALRLAGVTPVPVAVDAEGMDVAALAALDVQGVYVTPHHQYPTMVGLSAYRRQRLLALAAERRFVVIEDDYDHEFHFAGKPRLPLAHADQHGVVVYIGTLSKALAPGLRIGFLVAPPEVLQRAARLRAGLDRQGDQVTERAVAELLADGEIDRHIARMHRVYSARGALLAERVSVELGVPTAAPDGGLALWVSSPVDPSLLQTRSAARGVHFRIGSQHTFDGRADPHLRLGFAQLDAAELVRAMAVIGEEAR